MICNICKNEFGNIDGIKFCSYCGTMIEEAVVLEVEENTDESVDEVPDQTKDEVIQSGTKTDKEQDTMEMPAITEEDIKKYNKGRFFRSLKKALFQKRVVLPLVTAFVIIAVGIFGYKFLIAKPVDEEGIKIDLIGKIITLPKGTSIEIKKNYIKNLSINSRNTNKREGKDEIKAAVTLNNGSIEVTTLLSLVYTYEGNNQWKISDKIALAGNTAVKPVTVMDEMQLMDGLKKLNISIADTSIALGGGYVKKLSIVGRTPDLEKGKEEVLVETSIDNGMVAAEGKIKCELNFENEKWSIASAARNSTEDFALVLSPSFSQDKIIEAVKTDGLDETVTSSNLFGGKGFYIKDSFTKSISISDKKFNGQNGNLIVTARRENTAGALKTILLKDYTFSMSFSKTALLNKSETKVESASAENMDNNFIISTIAGAEIEVGNLFFLWSDNHKITTEEAKTFKTDEILSKDKFQNVKYVYGSITYMDGKKEKSISLVALYFLIYDSSNGYSWKLDRIIGENSPDYKTYSKASINQ